MWVVAIIMVIAFGGPYRFPGFCGNQHIRDPTWSQNPKQVRKWIEELFCWLQVLRQHFMFLAFCIHLHACPFIFLSFIPYMFIPMCIHVLSSSFHLHACSFILHSCPFICGNGSMTWPGDRVQQMVIAKIIAKKPSNIWHCSKEMYHKNDRVRQRERERASEFDAKWYGNCRKQGTTGWISLIGFARSVNVHNSICLAYAKFNGLSCMVPGYRFLGDLSLYRVSCISLTKKLRQYQSGLQPFWPWLMWIVWWWIVLACIIFIYWAPWKLLPVRHCTSLSLLGIIVMPYVLAVVQILGKNFLCGCGPQFIFWPWSL